MFKLYPKLAAHNLKSSYRVTVPYLLSGSGIIMMYYMLFALTMGTQQSDFYGVTSSGMALELGTHIIAIFGIIFLFYTNSFLMKRRKKELGLYNILGMEKRHIAGVILTETILTAAICLILGLGFGIIFSKVFFLILELLLGGISPVPFVIPLSGIRNTVILFSCIFLATALYNILQVRLSKPIELLHGGEAGEKEPRAHWLLAVIGAGLLGAGYYLAVTIEDPIAALTMFFVAVILVILGTYLLFMVGITAMLKLLKKKKGFYYKTRHFTTVSGMLYRMKQNAAGLASICILFTCLLVTVSTTFSLYTGIDDMVQNRCARDINFSVTSVHQEGFDAIKEKAVEAAAAHNAEMENIVNYSAWEMSAVREGNAFIFRDEPSGYSTVYTYFKVFTPEGYKSFSGQDCQVDPGRALMYDPEGRFDSDTVNIFGKSYPVEKIAMPDARNPYQGFLNIESYALVINDPELTADGRINNPDSSSVEAFPYFDVTYYLSFDIAGHDPETITTVYDDIFTWMANEKDAWQSYNYGDGISFSYNNAVSAREDFTGLYGGIFFLGLFMGAMFLMGTVLIIYYKQVSEGYEDARRFDIMQKVGMSHQEVKRSIHSQVLMVFFLPLLMAVIHLCFAFPMLRKILMLMNMVNFDLILLSIVGCVLIFSVFYMIIYALTARTYYRIVESAN